MKITELINNRHKILSKLDKIIQACFLLLEEKNNLDELQRNIEKKGELIEEFDEVSKELHSVLQTNRELTLDENNKLVKHEELWALFLKKDMEFKNQFKILTEKLQGVVKKKAITSKIHKAYKNL